MLSDWHLAVSRVKTHSALLALCNEFLDSWTPEYLARLPENCRPSRFEALGDIQHWVGVLSEALCAQQDEGPTMDALRLMLGFLFGASDRAAEINGAHDCANEALLSASPAPGPAA